MSNDWGEVAARGECVEAGGLVQALGCAGRWSGRVDGPSATLTDQQAPANRTKPEQAACTCIRRLVGPVTGRGMTERDVMATIDPWAEHDPAVATMRGELRQLTAHAMESWADPPWQGVNLECRVRPIGQEGPGGIHTRSAPPHCPAASPPNS